MSSLVELQKSYFAGGYTPITHLSADDLKLLKRLRGLHPRLQSTQEAWRRGDLKARQERVASRVRRNLPVSAGRNSGRRAAEFDVLSSRAGLSKAMSSEDRKALRSAGWYGAANGMANGLLVGTGVGAGAGALMAGKGSRRLGAVMGSGTGYLGIPVGGVIGGGLGVRRELRRQRRSRGV